MDDISNTIEHIFRYINQNPGLHSCNHSEYKNLKKLANENIKPLFSRSEEISIELGEFGKIIFPFTNLGNISSLNLFDIDELIVFSFYLKSRHRYSIALDFGANLGLHSLLMSKIGWNVFGFEPDPFHFNHYQKIVQINNLKTVYPINAAVSDKTTEVIFLNVHGNTTGSHIAGLKPAPYGGHTQLNVQTIDVKRLAYIPDFIKVDIEGAERFVVPRLLNENNNLDIMAEVGNTKNQEIIWDCIDMLQLNAYSQISGWNLCKNKSDIPSSYKEGSLFISKRNKPFSDG